MPFDSYILSLLKFASFPALHPAQKVFERVQVRGLIRPYLEDSMNP